MDKQKTPACAQQTGVGFRVEASVYGPHAHEDPWPASRRRWHMHMHIDMVRLAGFSAWFRIGSDPVITKNARVDRATGRSRFSNCFTWLQAAANDHGLCCEGMIHGGPRRRQGRRRRSRRPSAIAAKRVDAKSPAAYGAGPRADDGIRTRVYLLGRQVRNHYATSAELAVGLEPTTC